MRDGPPPIYRMPRCKACPRYCKPCLTIEEANAIQHERKEAKDAGSNQVWQMESICSACHKKSNRRQNEITAEKAGHGKKSNGRLAKIEALIKALDECERTGYTLTDEEMTQLNAKMKELGIG